MSEILTVGEILVEIMREKPGVGLDAEDVFIGPFASGAPAIFIDAVANLDLIEQTLRVLGILGGLVEVSVDLFGEFNFGFHAESLLRWRRWTVTLSDR